RCRTLRVSLEGCTGVGHGVRIAHEQQLTLVCDAQLLEGLQHLETHAARCHFTIATDGRTFKHETHPAIWQVDATAHLGMPFVGAVANTHPRPDAGRCIESIEIHALVVVGYGLWLVCVLVFRIQPETAVGGHVHMLSPAYIRQTDPLRPWLARLAPSPPAR